MCAGVFSIIDYCNSLYFGIQERLLNKLQSVQNAAVNLLRKKGGCLDVTTKEYIRKYHWLRVWERIIYKMCLLMHKAIKGVGPAWMQGLVAYNISERTLKLVQLPFLSKFGKRSFSRTGPRLWNLLPASVKNTDDTIAFKKGLKTFLFDGSERLMKKLYES